MAQSQPNQPTNTAILLILEQITALQRSMLTTLTTILSNQVKEMATEASIQAAADAIAAAITTLTTDVTNLTAADTALDTAVSNLLTYLQANPPSAPIPDALLAELNAAQSALVGFHTKAAAGVADVATQVSDLTNVVQVPAGTTGATGP